ncbi:hypothetical protein [Actinoplanes sp. NPDC049802]|uniref:hypothetical protein n=1 Tax=Actinoplanes sp. NPDC049802 TaxID=3154742 RepID=UPI0033F732F7
MAIVAQAGHLRRILVVVAPRALRRPYLGVVVPGGVPESPLAMPVSRLISAGLPRDPARVIAIATRRAERLWGLARMTGKRSYH